jgi:protein-S-isoprenylcysteine O-methyltransferase Ste14
MKIPAFHIAVTVALAFQFVHYFGAGARTFARPRLDEGGEIAGMLFIAAAAGVAILAWYQRIAVVAGALALVLVAVSLFLYEWTRRTIRGRGFFVIHSDYVPESVCDTGPYAYVRHPFYVSYMIGFTAALIAFPNVFTALGWLLAVWWLVSGARHDEKAIDASPLAEAYGDYRRRTGMFFPALRR